MEIAELVIKYIEVLIWPCAAIFIAVQFKNEVKSLFGKALDSHELEIDVLGQKMKLKALEQFTEQASSSHKIDDIGERKHNNDFVALQFARLIADLSTQEVMVLRHIARDMSKDGYIGCEAERLLLEKFINLDILDRNERGFYIPTEQGEKLLYTLKNL
ncbi:MULTISPECIES: hypothetical protein [Idiomarina]|jgi:hypothetical protein|uniref:hypothetical protein n=1 Tax=Idiomarina TaxID=135575 RepID=UPI000C0906E8|nr:MULTISPECIES: hypothetical protein [Idiomarina]MAC33242.1 hypothetical protein [Haliea sp.]MBF79669.1 hypothetical protein [Idiomarina sp.]|tara:strand:+ start:5170 stop:5646 length:477 start_codon:yes stop_codon:yes gene_type:complete